VIKSDSIIRITQELTLGQSPATPDTPDEAAFRAKVADQIAEIKAKGLIVDIPFEIPG
tara:strand:- start:839 stop:1012 length:174 start_codon:yes stop_codon:yes gene_type:complete